MSWFVPLAKNGGKYALKYGPHVKQAWDSVGPQAVDASKRAALSQARRRQALAKAATLVDGAVIKTVHQGDTIWVVLAGEEPVEAVPESTTSLDDLLRGVDMSKRLTWASYETRRLRARAKRVRARRRAE